MMEYVPNSVSKATAQITETPGHGLRILPVNASSLTWDEADLNSTACNGNVEHGAPSPSHPHPQAEGASVLWG